MLYAYNGTGKTRISMLFKDKAKENGEGKRDTLYFNAFTEDLFQWDNDLENNRERVLKINADSNFFNGFKELALEEKIFPYLERYADFDYKIDYEKWTISFSKSIRIAEEEDGNLIEKTKVIDNIKISRGEETIFIWCVFLAICQLTIEGAEAYNWVRYFFIDDPISSLDDNNAIAVASDLSQLLLKNGRKIKTVISTHHILFFNVLFNELKNEQSLRYFLHKNAKDTYTLRKTNDSPYFHHIASLSELKQAVESGNIKTFHFNILRSILEKTSSFFGFKEFGKCIHGIDDDVLFKRALNLLSHGKYSVYEPVDMNEDNKDLFKRIFTAFLEKYQFELPVLLLEETIQTT
ncbi:AAA family ATPase [Agriterribacter sp.]|uniref:AAA family ATPase n=1 Tax=Agriterribacter sp. TaxID=2821509 RepID=UPI002C6AF2B4|nr:AAA family ATPase [Agriterribacter sp.]HRP57017.1 AAA family ATPase [Agriterribacter sp.]